MSALPPIATAKADFRNKFFGRIDRKSNISIIGRPAPDILRLFSRFEKGRPAVSAAADRLHGELFPVKVRGGSAGWTRAVAIIDA
jgi:hypothetical protein